MPASAQSSSAGRDWSSSPRLAARASAIDALMSESGTPSHARWSSAASSATALLDGEKEVLLLALLLLVLLVLLVLPPLPPLLPLLPPLLPLLPPLLLPQPQLPPQPLLPLSPLGSTVTKSH